MAILETETGKDVNARTAQLVHLLTELGPDIPEISRRLGQFKESVRYRYKEKIVKRGFGVQAAVDHERLGLRRMILIIDFANEYRQYAQAILAAMNELCYLVSFARTMPAGEFIVNISAPAEVTGDIRSFFGNLQEKGMFTKLEVMDFDWFVLNPMRAERYDFDTGRWDYDWSNPPNESFESARHRPSEVIKFDYVDLLIMKELQMDATRSLKDISDNLKLNYKKLAWHYSTHVKAKRLLQGYSVVWMGTQYDYKIEKALHRKHRYFALQLVVKDVNEFELITLRQAANRLPFLWSESVGRNYSAEFAFPVDFAVEGLQYIAEAISEVRDRAELFTVDQTTSAAFTIPYRLFDAVKKKWVFEPQALAQRFDNLILQIKSGAG